MAKLTWYLYLVPLVIADVSSFIDDLDEVIVPSTFQKGIVGPCVNPDADDEVFQADETAKTHSNIFAEVLDERAGDYARCTITKTIIVVKEDQPQGDIRSKTGVSLDAMLGLSDTFPELDFGDDGHSTSRDGSGDTRWVRACVSAMVLRLDFLIEVYPHVANARIPQASSTATRKEKLTNSLPTLVVTKASVP